MAEQESNIQLPKLNENGIPSFESLPLRKEDPLWSAWGLYGDTDELGTLNRLTDERVAAAAGSEIRTGARISMNWLLNAQTDRAFFGRQVFHHNLFAKAPRTVNDDVWTFNSQSSSQWDGLRHYAYQKEALFYNGVTMGDIHGGKVRVLGEEKDGDGKEGEKSTVNGIQAWAEKGIVGRGVLVDYHAWRIQQGRENEDFDAFETTPIPLEDIKACLRDQGTEVRFGDILFIRSGWMSSYLTKTPSQLQSLRSTFPHHHFVGLQQSEEVLRWIWENFSAVSGDQPSFECWPSQQKDWSLHEVLLAGWGCPIGELFDLEKLAEHCRREGRWSFFVSSEVCNVVGGVASPPNILAIF